MAIFLKFFLYKNSLLKSSQILFFLITLNMLLRSHSKQRKNRRPDRSRSGNAEEIRHRAPDRSSASNGKRSPSGRPDRETRREREYAAEFPRQRSYGWWLRTWTLPEFAGTSPVVQPQTIGPQLGKPQKAPPGRSPPGGWRGFSCGQPWRCEPRNQNRI